MSASSTRFSQAHNVDTTEIHSTWPMTKHKGFERFSLPRRRGAITLPAAWCREFPLLPVSGSRWRPILDQCRGTLFGAWPQCRTVLPGLDVPLSKECPPVWAWGYPEARGSLGVRQCWSEASAFDIRGPKTCASETILFLVCTSYSHLLSPAHLLLAGPRDASTFARNSGWVRLVEIIDFGFKRDKRRSPRVKFTSQDYLVIPSTTSRSWTFTLYQSITYQSTR